jgi:hypothetical protein
MDWHCALKRVPLAKISDYLRPAVTEREMEINSFSTNSPATAPASARATSDRGRRRSLPVEPVLLRVAETNVLTFELVLGRAHIAAADHDFSAAELATRDEAHCAASWTRHYGNEWILSMPQFALVLEDKHGSGVHSFGDPFF